MVSTLIHHSIDSLKAKTYGLHEKALEWTASTKTEGSARPWTKQLGVKNTTNFMEAGQQTSFTQPQQSWLIEKGQF